MNEVYARGVGLLVIEVRNSNPNGDPDQDSDPRNRSHDRLGVISGVSFKRKVRDLVGEKDGPVWGEVAKNLGIQPGDWEKFEILEQRGRDRKQIGNAAEAGKVADKYWDARVFGATFLEKGADDAGDRNYIRGGVVQFGLGISVAPIEIERQTRTNKSGVQEGKDRGMAPMSFRVVQHGVYAMPFFVNPSAAHKTKCSATDLNVLWSMLSPAYPHTASDMRPAVAIRHAWYAEHKSAIGSFNDLEFLDLMTPIRKGERSPSTTWTDYEVPTDPGDPLRNRMLSFRDLSAY